jgi:hypothetical protein
VARAPEDRDVEGVVGRSVSAAVESVATAASAAGGNGSDAAEVGEGGLAAGSVGVVSGGHEHLSGDLDADPAQFEEVWGGGCHELLEVVVRVGDVFGQRLAASRQAPQGELRRFPRVVEIRPRAQSRAGSNQGGRAQRACSVAAGAHARGWVR